MGKVIFFLGACPKKFYLSKIDAWIASRNLNIVSFTVCSSPWGWYIGDDDGEPIEVCPPVGIVRGQKGGNHALF